MGRLTDSPCGCSLTLVCIAHGLDVVADHFGLVHAAVARVEESEGRVVAHISEAHLASGLFRAQHHLLDEAEGVAADLEELEVCWEEEERVNRRERALAMDPAPPPQLTKRDVPIAAHEHGEALRSLARVAQSDRPSVRVEVAVVVDAALQSVHLLEVAHLSGAGEVQVSLEVGRLLVDAVVAALEFDHHPVLGVLGHAHGRPEDGVDEVAAFAHNRIVALFPRALDAVQLGRSEELHVVAAGAVARETVLLLQDHALVPLAAVRGQAPSLVLLNARPASHGHEAHLGAGRAAHQRVRIVVTANDQIVALVAHDVTWKRWLFLVVYTHASTLRVLTLDLLKNTGKGGCS